jgi:hypothetical protein
LNPSVVPEPVHAPDAQPAQFAHLPVAHCASAVHQHVVPDAVHAPPGEVTLSQLPVAHANDAEHMGIPGLVSWQCIPSQFVPVPVQGPLPLHWCCVASLMHLPLTPHAASLVHQQH